MGYGRNNKNESTIDSDTIKRKFQDKMPNIDLDKIDENEVKNVLLNQIDKNPNISKDIKDKINQGDISGLKEELIKYLDNKGGNDAANSRIKNMLENNDYDGLQNELMGIFFKTTAAGQKKNEVKDDKNPFAGILNDTFINAAINKIGAGNKNDSRINLLNSIKPFMSEGRQNIIDECVKAVNLLIIAEKLGLKVGK